MQWTFADNCRDGRGAQLRFFDLTHGGFWPADPTQVFAVQDDGVSKFATLTCVPSARICYGAEPNPTDGSVYWGAGLEGTMSCDACCATCGNGNPPPISLVCN